MRVRNLALVVIFAASMVGQTPSWQAREALAKGDYKRAAEFYSALLRDSPSSPELLSNLGMALHLQGKSSEAIRVLERSVSVRELPPALAMLGVDYCRLRQFDLAAAVLRRARRFASDMEVMSALAPCYLEAGDPMDAVLVYQDLADHALPPEDENEAGLAKAYFRASKHYLAQLEKAPRNAAYLQAVEQARTNSSPNARGAFAAAFLGAPYVHVDTSFANFQTLLQQHPNDAPLLYFIGVLAGERAMEAYQDCEKRFPNSTALRRLHADMLHSEGHFEEAAAEYLAIRDFANLGNLYRENAEWDKALESFRSLAAENPEDERAVAGMSESLVRLGRFSDVKRELQLIVNRPNAPVWALLDGSKAEQELGDVKDAIRHLEIAAKEYPSNEIAHYRLIKLYKTANRPELAAREVRLVGQLKRKEK